MLEDLLNNKRFKVAQMGQFRVHSDIVRKFSMLFFVFEIFLNNSCPYFEDIKNLKHFLVGSIRVLQSGCK